MKLLIAGALLLCGAISLSACGEASQDEPEEDQVFDCLNITCDAGAGEICVYERYAATQEQHSAKCVVPTPACTSCDCARQVAIDSFEGSSNCDATIACSSSNGAVTVACTNPFF